MLLCCAAACAAGPRTLPTSTRSSLAAARRGPKRAVLQRPRRRPKRRLRRVCRYLVRGGPAGRPWRGRGHLGWRRFALARRRALATASPRVLPAAMPQRSRVREDRATERRAAGAAWRRRSLTVTYMGRPDTGQRGGTRRRRVGERRARTCAASASDLLPRNFRDKIPTSVPTTRTTTACRRPCGRCSRPRRQRRAT